MSASSLCSSLLQSKGLGEGLKLRKGSLSPTSTRRNFQTTKTSARVVKFSKNDISVSPSILSANFAKLGHQTEKMKKRGSKCKVNALPDWPLMAVLVEHVQGQRDFIIHKSVWHLSDEAIKNVYTMYIMFTCWGCCFFGAAKDPYYDSEAYRKDGGDGTGNWVYEKQDDIEESARAALWREELIEEIEQKVEGLRELEEAKKEKLVR